MITIGIDPGLDGALTFLVGDKIDLSIKVPTYKVTIGKKTKTHLDEREITGIIKNYKNYDTKLTPRIYAYLEKVGAMPNQGVVSMFRFGEAWGIMKGILSGLHIKYELVRPQEWQKSMLNGRSEYEVCNELWPDQNWLASPRCRKPHDGMLDSALIAEWGRTHG